MTRLMIINQDNVERKEYHIGRQDTEHAFHAFLPAYGRAHHPVHFHLHGYTPAGLQALHADVHLYVHRADALAAHPSLPQIPGMVTYRTGTQGKAHRALYHLHTLLLRLFLLPGISPCPTRVEHRAHRRSFGADGVRFHQYMVEDIHAHSGYRRYGGSIAGLRRKIRFQSHLVALPDAHHSGHGGKQPHDIAPTLLGAGGSGLLRGTALRIPYYIIEEKTNIT